MRKNNENRTGVITTTAVPPHVTGLPTVAGQVIAVRETDGLSTVLTDHLGSVLGEVDGFGTLMGEQRYLPFGEVRRDVGSNPAVDLSFTGQRALEVTGLIDYKARQYDPSLRSFIQPDSVIPEPYDVQDWNRYAYVHGNPVRFTDPSGNCIQSDGNIDWNSGPFGTSGLCKNLIISPQNDNPVTIDGGKVAEWSLDNWAKIDEIECTYPCTEFVSKSLLAGGAIEGEYWYKPNDCNANQYAWNYTDMLYDYLTLYDNGPNLEVITFEKSLFSSGFPAGIVIPAGSIVFYNDGENHDEFKFIHAAVVTGRNVSFEGKLTPEVVDQGGFIDGPHSILQTSKPYILVIVLLHTVE